MGKEVKWTCDRCGKPMHDPYVLLSIIRVGYEETFRADLCKKCSAAVQEFVSSSSVPLFVRPHSEGIIDDSADNC